jgi:methyl-accepting chemotaxis protein
MQNMAQSMSAIAEANERLKQITSIIEDISKKTNVINDIVFKTQLLSVNASIEAARAGVHGKGFAVVANEVGNLANLSGRAASEIRNLLNQSREQVSAIVGSTDESVKIGQQVANEAIRSFEMISKSILSISERVNQINEATREQEIGVKQTSLAMGQMNQATADNNALANTNATLSDHIKLESEKISSIGTIIGRVLMGQSDLVRVKRRTLGSRLSLNVQNLEADTLPQAVAEDAPKAEAMGDADGLTDQKQIVQRLRRRIEASRSTGQSPDKDHDQNKSA